MDTVRTEVPTRRQDWRTCDHSETTRYTRVDYRAGPGSLADNYEGTACVNCGLILEEAGANHVGDQHAPCLPLDPRHDRKDDRHELRL